MLDGERRRRDEIRRAVGGHRGDDVATSGLLEDTTDQAVLVIEPVPGVRGPQRGAVVVEVEGAGRREVDGAIDQRAGPGEEGQELGDAGQGGTEDACRARLGRRHATASQRAAWAVALPQRRRRGMPTASTLGV